MAKTQAELREGAIAEGYKDETCSKCGTMFEAHKHFVLCDVRPCPMVSTSDPRSLFDRMAGLSVEEATYTAECASSNHSD